MKLSNIKRLSRDDMPDLPGGEWADLWMQTQNQSSEQLTQALQNALTFGDNFNAALGVFRFTHGVARTIPVPDGVRGRPVGIDCWRCIQVPGTTRPVFAYLDWQHVDNDNPKAKNQVTITPYFAAPPSGVGSIGERYSINRVRSNNTAITSGVTMNVCTTASVDIPAGTWLGSGVVAFSGSAGTTTTDMQAGISKTSATLPAADSMGVPTAGEFRMRHNSTGTIITAGEWTVSIPPYKATFATTTTLSLVASQTFGVSTSFVYGSMEFVRLTNGCDAVPPQADLLLFFCGG